MRKQDFTIIELLIVIAIITILAGMLLPALKTARDQAKAIQCKSNFHQTGLAVQSYVNDNNGWFPHSYTFSKIVKNGYITPNIFTCPSHTNEVYQYAFWEGNTCSYIWSYRTSGYIYPSGSYLADCYPVHLSMVQKPSFDPLLSDGKWESTTNPYYGIAYYLSSAFLEASYMAIPHNKGNNLLFIDGHSKWFNRSTYTSDILCNGDIHPQTGVLLSE